MTDTTADRLEELGYDVDELDREVLYRLFGDDVDLEDLEP